MSGREALLTWLILSAGVIAGYLVMPAWGFWPANLMDLAALAVAAVIAWLRR